MELIRPPNENAYIVPGLGDAVFDKARGLSLT
jgi:uracil phosphoribosyltransferase